MTAVPRLGQTSGPTAPLLSDISARQGRRRVSTRLSVYKPAHASRHRKPQIVCRFGGEDLLFLTRDVRSQLVGDRFGDFTLDREDVSQFAIKSVGPKMRIIGGFD